MTQSRTKQYFVHEASLKPQNLILVLNEIFHLKKLSFYGPTITSNGKILHVSCINLYHSPIIQRDIFSMFGTIRNFTVK